MRRGEEAKRQRGGEERGILKIIYNFFIYYLQIDNE
jgi:hypothetical protein